MRVRRKFALALPWAYSFPMLHAFAVTMLALPLVVIDPGHGGDQLGAKGACGVLEKDVVLSIARELASIIEASGHAETLMTRQDDRNVPLEKRAAIANERGASLFVSVHANASVSANHAGVETFFLSTGGYDRSLRELVRRENEGRVEAKKAPIDPLKQILTGLSFRAVHRESQRLAMRLHDELARTTRERARGVMQAPFVVLRQAEMAAALVEVGFLTHPRQCHELASRSQQRAVARRLAGAVIAHLRSESRTLAEARP